MRKLDGFCVLKKKKKVFFRVYTTVIGDDIKGVIGFFGSLGKTICVNGSGHDNKNPRKGGYCDTDNFSSKTFNAIHHSYYKVFLF